MIDPLGPIITCAHAGHETVMIDRRVGRALRSSATALVCGASQDRVDLDGGMILSTQEADKSIGRGAVWLLRCPIGCSHCA